MASNTHVCGYLSRNRQYNISLSMSSMGGGLLTWYFVLVTVLLGIDVHSGMGVVHLDILSHLVQNLFVSNNEA